MNNTLAIIAEPYKVSYLQRPLPAPKPDEVIIHIRASAICGSDLHIFKGKHPAAKLPVTIGHEFSGDIMELGSDVTGFCVGDRVTLEPVVVCNHCDACMRGEYSYCRNISFTYRNGDGALAKYIVAKAQYVYKLPDTLSYEAGALIEPLSVAVHAARRADIRLNDTVAIFGAGAIGIFIAATCARMGARRIVITDFSRFRLDKALEMGATHAVEAADPQADSMMAELAAPDGYDKSFECVGIGTTFNKAMQVLRSNGLMTVAGIFEQPSITIDASRFVSKEVRVQGTQGYCRDFPIALELAQHIVPEKLITHRFSLDQLQCALNTAIDPAANTIKCLICN